MANFLNALVPFAVGAVFVVLLFGVFTLFKGGDFSRSYSNKLMRLRVVLQFLAVVIMMAALYLHSI